MKHEWKKQEKGFYATKQMEGVWKQKQGDDLVKDELEYTIMIRQPDFITESMACKAMEAVKKKKPNPLYEEIRFDTMQDGKYIEILHIGAFDDEPASFEKMTQVAKKKQSGTRQKLSPGNLSE